MQLAGYKRYQRGAALLVSLLMLTILTLIGVVGMSTSGLEEKMTGNQRNQAIAFQAAESALREGERFIETTPDLSTTVSDNCASGLCTTSRQDPAFDDNATHCASNWVDERWEENTCALNLQVWSTATRHRELIEAMPEVQTKPRYIIEFFDYVVRDLSAGTPTTTAPAYDGTGGSSGWQAEWSEMYRITALATGGAGASQVMLQSTYKKNLD